MVLLFRIDMHIANITQKILITGITLLKDVPNDCEIPLLSLAACFLFDSQRVSVNKIYQVRAAALLVECDFFLKFAHCFSSPPPNGIYE